MHLIEVKEHFFDKEGRFNGMSIEAMPLFGDDRVANQAVYQEIWHRLRRDMFFKPQKTGIKRDFDAIIYFSATTGEDGKLRGNIVVNTVGTSELYEFDWINSQKNAMRSLRRMDRLLYELFYETDEHDTALAQIGEKFALSPAVAMDDLKGLLKIYCRSRGLFINEGDVKRANKQAKQRRRAKYYNNVISQKLRQKKLDT